MFGVVREPFGWEHWLKVRPMLAASAERGGDVTIEDIEKELAEGRALLWATETGDFAGVTQILRVNDGRQCFIWQMGGGGPWRGYLETIEEYARAEGCRSIEGNMRPGFERVLKDWEKVAVVLRKELAGG